MLDLSTLDTLTDRQLLIRLIALLTSLVKVQHRDRSPSSTVCRNGANCSYQPNCWFSHAPHSVRRSGTPASVPQRPASTWRTPRPCRATATATPSPPCFTSRNGFGPLAPRRRRRRSPAPLRASTATQPSDASSPPPSCTTLSESSPSSLRRRRRHKQRRRYTTTCRSTSTSSTPPASCTNSYPSPRLQRSSSPWRPPPPPPPTEFPIAPPSQLRLPLSASQLRLHRLRHEFDAVTFDDISRIAAATPHRRSSTLTTYSAPAPQPLTPPPTTTTHTPYAAAAPSSAATDMPSLQSSSGFGTPDPEVFFDDLCHETCDLDPDPEFFFGDLCFEAPSDLDATSDALDALDALQHTDPALKELLAVAARVVRYIPREEEGNRWSIERCFHQFDFNARYAPIRPYRPRCRLRTAPAPVS